MADTIAACLSDEVPLEEAALADAISNRRPGTRAFALPPERIGNKTVVLIGNDALGWTRALACYGGEHWVRARAYAKRFNSVACEFRAWR
jgi:hypothetical protein